MNDERNPRRQGGPVPATGFQGRLLGLAATPIAWPLAVFFASALGGFAVAYDTASATSKLAWGGAGAMVLFVPVALLSRPGQHAPLRIPWREHRTAAVAAGIVLLLVLALPAARSAWMSNLGALRQSRAELSTYEWPRWPVQDAARRAIAPRLAVATSRYESALRLEASNAAANRRLGQIELSLGHYDSARQHLEAAFDADPHGHATRQLLGEALAVTGDVTRAAEAWRSLELEPDRLALRQYWYDRADPGQRAEWMRAAIALATARQASSPKP